MSAHSEGIAIHRVTVRRHWSRRPVLLFAAGAIGLLVALVLGVALGTVAVAPLDTIGILGRRLLGLPIAQTWTPPAETIVLDLRLPRVLEAMVVGLGLSVAGTAFQGLLRDPLADPYVLGTASGAALGGHRGRDPGEDARARVRSSARARICRSAARRVDGVSPEQGQPARPTDRPRPDRLCRGVAPGGRAGHGHVPLRGRPPADLRLPPRRTRWCLVGAARRRGAAHPRRQ